MTDEPKYFEIRHEHAQSAARAMLLGQFRWLDMPKEELLKRSGLTEDRFDSVCAGTATLTYVEIAELVRNLFNAELRVVIDWKHLQPADSDTAREQCDADWKAVQERWKDCG